MRQGGYEGEEGERLEGYSQSNDTYRVDHTLQFQQSCYEQSLRSISNKVARKFECGFGWGKDW